MINYSEIRDIKEEKPSVNGWYAWYDRFLGFTPVRYEYGRFFLLNGDEVTGVVRYWKKKKEIERFWGECGTA